MPVSMRVEPAITYCGKMTLVAQDRHDFFNSGVLEQTMADHFALSIRCVDSALQICSFLSSIYSDPGAVSFGEFVAEKILHVGTMGPITLPEACAVSIQCLRLNPGRPSACPCLSKRQVARVGVDLESN